MKKGQERLRKAGRPLFKAKALQVRRYGLIQLSGVGLLLPPLSAETGHTPRLNAKRFEGLIVDRIRSNILTESNIRDLVRIVDEEMDGVAHEQRQRLETIEGELAEVKQWLDRLYRAIETTDLDIADIAPRIKEHRERQERLEPSLRPGL